MCAVCVALAQGLMIPWLPADQVQSLKIPNLESETEKPEKARKSAGKKTTAAAPAAKGGFTIPAEAAADLKKALEV